nr:PREDICTED: uncharacterized protein LOC109040652 isoform X1 [Bemisia tabaci]
MRVPALLTLVACALCSVSASEFPDRECCDPVFPLAALSASVTPDTAAAATPGTSENEVTNKIKTFNCLLARQMCFDDPSCAPILETVPRVCGAESVSCSTATVTKCQAALRILQAFPFFKPTCLCREPQVDQECNSFRNFLFDHPCMFVSKKEKDPFPVDTLPTCNHALDICLTQRECSEMYEDFRSSCKVKNGECALENRSSCQVAWREIHFSPMFGCICPPIPLKRKCDRIFSLVNQNPCIVKEPARGWGWHWFRANPWLVAARPGPRFRLNVTDTLVYPTSLFEDPRDYYGLTQRSGTPGGNHGAHYPARTQPHPHTPSSGIKAEEAEAMNFQSTCAEALEMCTGDPDCQRSLNPVLQHCDMNRCHRHQCMKSLQNFYRSNDLKWSVEIAFCLCKKTSDSQDSCLAAQKTLHPVCAQQDESATIPTCHSLAEKCKADQNCRLRLEQFEQACAVDSVTKECTGPPSECRIAMLGILGTVLRSNCACNGTDFSQLYECMGWQRVLWFNPCVVQAQREFHAAKLRGDAIQELSPTTRGARGDATTQTTTTPTPAAVPTTPTTTASPSTAPAAPTTARAPPSEAPTTRLTTAAPTTTTPTTTTSTTTTQRPTSASTESELENMILVTTTPTEAPTEAPTEPTSTASTLPPRYCVVQRPPQKDQYIPEGEGKRLYRDSEPDCSEVCQCTDGEVLVCNTVCVQRTPCKTDFAFYNHAAPSYQAFRGSCLCYSGRFICMRPIPDAYKLSPGVYIFLGYSQADEELLKPIVGMDIRDAVAALQAHLKSMNPNTNCVLSIFSMAMENVVLVAKIVDSNSSLIRSQNKQRQNSNLLQQEKNECAEPLKDISSRINSRDPSVHSHVLLSMFKISEVEVMVPPSSHASPTLNSNPQLNLTLVLSFLTLFLYSNSISFRIT